MKRAFLTALLLSAVPIASPSAASAQDAKQTADLSAPARTFGRVSFDARSLMIDGKRQVIWSGEFHPSDCPAPTSGGTCCRR